MHKLAIQDLEDRDRVGFPLRIWHQTYYARQTDLQRSCGHFCRHFWSERGCCCCVGAAGLDICEVCAFGTVA